MPPAVSESLGSQPPAPLPSDSARPVGMRIGSRSHSATCSGGEEGRELTDVSVAEGTDLWKETRDSWELGSFFWKLCTTKRMVFLLVRILFSLWVPLFSETRGVASTLRNAYLKLLPWPLSPATLYSPSAPHWKVSKLYLPREMEASRVIGESSQIWWCGEPWGLRPLTKAALEVGLSLPHSLRRYQGWMWDKIQPRDGGGARGRVCIVWPWLVPFFDRYFLHPGWRPFIEHIC